MACGRAAPAAEAPAQPPRLADAELLALIDRIKSSNGKDEDAVQAFRKGIAHGHIALVIDQLDVGYPGWNPILIDALKQVVTTEDKALVLGTLKRHVSLIHLVRRFQWERDAKDTLVEMLARMSSACATKSPP